MFSIPVKSLHKTIFVRLLVLFGMIILPIIILGIYLYNWSYENATKDISRNAIVQLTSYIDDLNREIEWLEIQQYDILQENKLNKIAFTWESMTNIEKKSHVNDILHRLTSIKNTNAYIKDIYIHLPTINKSISAVNAVQELDETTFQNVMSSMTYDGNRMSVISNQLAISAASISINQSNQPDIVVQIELDKQKMTDELNTLNLYPKSATFLYSNQEGVLLSSGEDGESLEKEILPNLSRSIEYTNERNSAYQMNQSYSEALELYVISFIPKEIVRKPLKKFSTWAWLFAITLFVAISIYCYAIFTFVHKPLLQLVEGFKRMEKGILDETIVHKKEDEFGFLYERYNKMLYKLQRLINQDYKQKLMMQKAELKQLQSQINPHFLYNSFFILHSLAKTEDIHRIEMFTKMLGEYFRYITRNGESNVTLKDEIKHARMYTEIQSLRFSRRIQVQFDELPKEMEEIKVPKLIIQPIIENAFEHCLEKMTDVGFLRVSFKKEKNCMYIFIEDNGNVLNENSLKVLNDYVNNIDNQQETTGLINIHRRIALTFGNKSGLQFENSEWNGLKVIVRIHIEGNDSNV
ncbi:sensor histidine kinase [Gracilibacillus marinus]|uniref:Sensor histidine kinase n=1 Tax=Gracilibacillus marinus TaxID=630535 RepID=A0ABV8VY21_9BACI